jgi:Spy/CpxP family protein refolding chaperone
MAVLTVVAMLCIGMAGGILLDRTLLHRSAASGRNGRDRRGGGPFGMMTEPVDTASRTRMRGRIMKRITDDLSLTAAQATAVEAIFVRHEHQLDSVRTRVGPQLDSLRNAMRASMDSVLTPEQRVKLAETRKRMRERRRGDDVRGRGGDSARR